MACQNFFEAHCRNLKIILFWIPGHKGIFVSEKVYALARSASLEGSFSSSSKRGLFGYKVTSFGYNNNKYFNFTLQKEQVYYYHKIIFHYHYIIRGTKINFKYIHYIYNFF